MAVSLALYFVLPFLLYWIVSIAPGFVRWYRKYRRICEGVEQFTGEPTAWLWGNMHTFPGPTQAGLDYLASLAEKYVKCNRFYQTTLKPCIGVFHPDTVKVVLQSTAPKDTNGLLAVYRLLTPWIGDGLITANGEKWHRNRRLLTPAFHFGVLKPYCSIYNRSADKLVSLFRKACSEGKPVEIFDPVLACTLDTVLKCAFSYEGDIQAEMERGGNKYITAVTNIAPMVVDRMMFPPMVLDFLYYNFGEGRKFQSLLDTAHGMTADVIAQRRDALNNGNHSQKKKHKDFLDILLSAKDEDGQGLRDREIAEEVDTFLFAGHDTTGSAIAWALHSFANYPQLQARAREEVDALFNSKDDQEITMDDLSQLEFVTQCIKESMRLNTVVTGIWRELDTELELEGKTLPAGTIIDINLHALHHNPHVWGDDVDEFKPDRFSAENRKKMDTFAFVPFSAGPRNCIGQNFAMNEIKVVIAKLLRSFEMAVDQGHKTERAMHIILRARNGIWLRLTPRIHTP